MGKKSKKHANRQSADDTFKYAQRAMEKQDFKEALKNAKLCFRQDPSHDHRQILERSWLARGLQLARAGLQPEGRAAAQELLALGVSLPDVQRGLPELLLAVGLYDQAMAAGKIPGGVEGPDPTVLARAADRAVTDPLTAPASLPGIRQGATMIRAALDGLSAGDEGLALAAVADVPRNSPFAEWKLFVRGLAAYYRRDDAAMRANWDHLSPDRYAARLAAPLRRLAAGTTYAGAATGDSVAVLGSRDEFRQAIRILESALLGGSLVWYLESLQKSLGDDRWREAVTGIRRWKKEFQARLPDLAQRLDRLFYDLAIRKANIRWLNELATGVDPPRWDPRWNRARAMIAEMHGEDIETVQQDWLAYLEDLASIPDFKPSERRLAQAMVWERLGQRWAEEDEEECNCEHCRRAREEEARAEGVDWLALEREPVARTKTIECLNKAIELAPDLSSAYHALALNYTEWEQEDAAAEVHRRLLAHVPDDLDAIVALFRYHGKRGDALPARDYALQARRLKPASEEMLKMVVAGRFLAARALTVQGRPDAAHAELAAVDHEYMVPAAGTAEGNCRYDLAVHRAMIELKAGLATTGMRCVEQALAEADDPADVYLALAIEAVRYDLPFELGGSPQYFLDRWHRSLKKRRSRIAGPMARRMRVLLDEAGPFTGKHAFLNAYLERVVKYVSGCSRIRWQADDLLQVCRFLDQVLENCGVREVRKPLVKFLDIGRKKFAQEPEFHVTRGELEMRRGPSYCDRDLAHECFEKAIEFARVSSHPKAKEIQQLAGRRLRQLDSAGSALPRRRTSRAPDDFAGLNPELFQGRGTREEMIEMIKRLCDKVGMDPEQMVEKMLEKLSSAAAAAGRI